MHSAGRVTAFNLIIISFLAILAVAAGASIVTNILRQPGQPLGSAPDQLTGTLPLGSFAPGEQATKDLLSAEPQTAQRSFLGFLLGADQPAATQTVGTPATSPGIAPATPASSPLPDAAPLISQFQAAQEQNGTVSTAYTLAVIATGQTAPSQSTVDIFQLAINRLKKVCPSNSEAQIRDYFLQAYQAVVSAGHEVTLLQAAILVITYVPEDAGPYDCGFLLGSLVGYLSNQ